MADLVVAGAGMAGLAAAAEARRLGAEPLVLEKLDRPGGSMRLSSGVVWRHRELERFVAECPDGDARLQRLLFERLDDDLRWLESLGAPVVERDTGNPLTTGTRFEPAGLTDALVEAAGGVRLGEPLREPPADVPLILATGGFGASRELLREHVTPEADHAFLRAAPGEHGRWSSYRARGGRGHQRGARAGVRTGDAGAAGARRRGRPRAAVAALRPARSRDERARRALREQPPGPRSTWPSGSSASRVRGRGLPFPRNG